MAGDAWAPLPPTPMTPQLWYWHHSYLSPTNANEPAHSEQLVDQAVAAGYTGLAFWDSSLTFVNRPGWDASKLQTVVQYARSKGLAVLASGAPVGYSNDMLQSDPNLAEGARIVGGQQIIAGYYDSGNGAKSATDELNAATGIEGVIGFMYTSWQDDYSQMKAYADAAKAAWPAYRQSAP